MLSRRNFFKAASASPLILAPAIADPLLIGPTCPIDAQVLYRLHGNAVTQANLGANGIWDNDLAAAFTNESITAMLNVDDRVLDAVCTAAPFLTEESMAASATNCAMASELYAAWGLSAPGGWSIAPALSSPSMQDTQAMLIAPYTIREALIKMSDSVDFALGSYPIITSTHEKQPLFELAPRPPVNPAPIIPDWDHEPPRLPGPGYTASDSTRAWDLVARNGRLLATTGFGIAALARLGPFVALVGAGPAGIITGVGLCMVLIGAYYIYRSSWSVVYVNTHYPKEVR